MMSSARPKELKGEGGRRKEREIEATLLVQSANGILIPRQGNKEKVLSVSRLSQFSFLYPSPLSISTLTFILRPPETLFTPLSTPRTNRLTFYSNKKK